MIGGNPKLIETSGEIFMIKQLKMNHFYNYMDVMFL